MGDIEARRDMARCDAGVQGHQRIEQGGILPIGAKERSGSMMHADWSTRVVGIRSYFELFIYTCSFLFEGFISTC